MTFRDRDDAGRRLADKLSGKPFDRPVVLALPRGGVPVAAHVADRLGAPLEVFVARKIGAPGQPEFGIGAIAEGDDLIIETRDARRLGISGARMRALAAAERRELNRRVETYRGTVDLPDLEDRDVILVDDGLATGVTAEAALRALRRHRPQRLILAVPVCPPETARRLTGIADQVIAVESQPGMGSIGSWYENFTQTSDEQVVALLATRRPRQAEIAVPGGGSVYGDLESPPDPVGVVLFAHGSGSSRNSPRNRHVARALHRRGLATLLMDLLTETEELQDAATGSLRFDIELLADRLDLAREWLSDQASTAGLPLGCFGASTGAAAALICAARAADQVSAVVSRGGRPDLAGNALRQVSAPTLLIVGGRDEVVLDLNRQALEQLSGPKRLEVVDGAGHLFEEPGALDEVARLSGDWLIDHLAQRPSVSNRA